MLRGEAFFLQKKKINADGENTANELLAGNNLMNRRSNKQYLHRLVGLSVKSCALQK
jgi:hypothetical protein